MFIKVLKAIGDETRFQIIQHLLNHDHCVSGLSKKIGISDSAISQHLSILRDADLVSSLKKGYFTHYSLNRKLLKEIGFELIHLLNQKPMVDINFEDIKAKCVNGGK